MRRSLLLLCAVLAALGAPAPRISILGRLGKATMGVAIGSAATNMATGIASQSLGIVGQALGQIPILGPFAQMGTTIGQAGVEAGNSFAQMGLGIGQAAVDSHVVMTAPINTAVAQNTIQGLSDVARASGASAPGVLPSSPVNLLADGDQHDQRNPMSDYGVIVPQDAFNYDYEDYNSELPDGPDAHEQGPVATNRPPPPQPTYIGVK